MSRDPQCVFATSDPGMAEIVVAWLQGHGILADAVYQPSPAKAQALMEVGPRSDGSYSGIADPEFRVWIADDRHLDRALRLLGEHAASESEPIEPAPVSIECWECGRNILFPPEQRGTKQECPSCGAPIEVPE